jgi:hypothetical protein
MKEPVQLIEEMHQMLIDMQQQVRIMDNNIKILQAKVNAEVFAPLTKQITSGVHEQNKPPPPPEQPPLTIKATTPEDPTQYKATMVQGKYLSEDGKPLHGIPVKILNGDKKVIKETSTNRAGVWMAHLRPGKYIAKMIIDGRPAQYRLFEVKEGQAQLDV